MTEPLQTPWQIWADTGGTFTDCVAISPAGEQRCAKVLSSSALRARVVAVTHPRGLVIAHDWPQVVDLVRGLAARCLSGGINLGSVSAFDPASSELRLDRDFPPTLAPGDTIELVCSKPAPVLAAHLVTGTPIDTPLPPIRFRLATTRGTNALLERRGAPVALFLTEGFADLLLIGTQQRPDLFALHIRKPEPLYREVIEVRGRLDAGGVEMEPLDLPRARVVATDAIRRGITCAAIALMHSWRDPRHELALAGLLRELGFTHISVSSELSPSINYLRRAQTALVNAYLAPVVGQYLTATTDGLGDATLHVMTSAGGLTRAEHYPPKDSLLSGPAGGVVGALAAAAQSGLQRIITFDMGGTSTDVARADGVADLVFEHHVGEAHISAPAVAVESVAAGGGSVCWYDADGGPCVGPHSAGAHPGPACYGAGGPLTITDVNVLLGRLDPSRFGIPISVAAARAAAERLLAEIESTLGHELELDALLRGFLDIANERMAQAIRRVSIQRGYDPADHTLLAFGGAGGQHACALADRLGIHRICIPEEAGLLSAVGLGQARIERVASRQVLLPLDASATGIDELIAQTFEQARALIVSELAPDELAVAATRIVSLRLKGQDAAIAIEVSPPTGVGATQASLRREFDARYRNLYGYDPPDRPIEIESIRVIASGAPPSSGAPRCSPRGRGSEVASPAGVGAASGDQSAWRMKQETSEVRGPARAASEMSVGTFDGPILARESIPPDLSIPGPAIIADRYSTTVVERGWSARIDAAGALHIARTAPLSTTSVAAAPELVRAIILSGRLAAIAEDMGHTLQRTALSTNIKERLDFSCGILDASAELVVNAPHIPVHLGALGACVRGIREVIELSPGDVVVTNHPAFGGSHLPDITVVTPVFDPAESLLAYVACRAHHAELGGTRPGSMPTDATRLSEEGVVIPPMYLVRSGRSAMDNVERLLSSGPYPSRAPAENLADLSAQIAANNRGAREISALAAEVGARALAEAMAALKDRAESRIRQSLQKWEGRVFEGEDSLDDGTPLRVRIKIRAGQAFIDFTGSGPVHPGNFNTPIGVIRSVVMYVLRLLVDEPMPLNEGLMRAVTLTIPPGFLNPEFPTDPTRCPAVAAGNTETSQRIANLLIRVLGLAAESQGTMNNVLFGNERFGYYETICGGSGAGPTFSGTSAVHTHMTNTRITDPEILESRYPVRVERFAIRRGSGGAGFHRGGDGVIREFTFLDPVTLSVLTQHRNTGPHGLVGGTPGAVGVQQILRSDGSIVELAHADTYEALPGDRFLIQTPGAGGCGSPAAISIPGT